jgi:hypothetical protein
MTAAEPPIGYVRLRDAADTLGQKLKGSRWRPIERIEGPYNVLSPRELNPDLDEIVTVIAEQCIAGEIAAIYRTVTGGIESLAPDIWHQPHRRNYFVTGTIELVLPLVDVDGRPNADGHTAKCEREIFLKRDDLDHLVATLSKPNAKPSRRASKKQIRQIVSHYRRELSDDTNPSIEDVEQFARKNGLLGFRDELREEYRKQFGPRPVGRPPSK